MVVTEVTRMEEERYKVKAVWTDVWKILQARLSFLIRSTYITLPCPLNLHQWFGREECCTICNTPNANLQHILSGCKIALAQGRCRWRNDQVLRKLAEMLEHPDRAATGYQQQ